MSIEEKAAEIEEYFDEKYPRDFLEKYCLLECLAKSHGTETFLAKSKEQSGLFVAKIYDRTVFSFVSEIKILKELCHEGLPEFADSFEDENFSVTVRSYVEGTPLDAFAAKNRISEARTKEICIELCDILFYLHSQKPPIIHRDIKPQNIIVKPDGKIALIDFDIARQFDDGAETDTQFFGTRFYAPPEQYGFSQTDCRTDIYSLGVLLRFLLTGSEKEQDSSLPEEFLPIVERCTAFSPKDRFQTAAAVKKALFNSSRNSRKNKSFAAILILTAAVFACLGFFVGRNTDFLAMEKKAVFAEPLIEQAVRVQLGKAEDEPVYEKELPEVTALFIFGNEVSATQETFSAGLSEQGRYTRGSIVSLEDLAQMPNISEIQIAYQLLEDISGIENLRLLRYANLMHNFINDISPLAGLPALEEIRIYETDVSDAKCLSECPRIKIAELGKTLITSPKMVGGESSLEYVSFAHTNTESLEGIENFRSLRSINVCYSRISNFERLAELPELFEIRVDESQYESAEKALGEKEIDIIIE